MFWLYVEEKVEIIFRKASKIRDYRLSQLTICDIKERRHAN